MATGENALFLVTKRRSFASSKKLVPDKVFVFRTRDAAIEFWRKKSKNSRDFSYTYPQRATWGPEQ